MVDLSRNIAITSEGRDRTAKIIEYGRFCRYSNSHGGPIFDPTAGGPAISDAGVLAAVSSAWCQAA